MFPGPKVRPGLLITVAAVDKAKAIAEDLGGVSLSNAIEAAIHAFKPAAAGGRG